jgi:hypothetical protein
MTGRGPWTGEPHQCPARGCTETVDRLLCRGHWYRVPRSLQAWLWASWDSGRGVHSVEHQLATGDAIAAASGTVLAKAC